MDQHKTGMPVLARFPDLDDGAPHRDRQAVRVWAAGVERPADQSDVVGQVAGGHSSVSARRCGSSVLLEGESRAGRLAARRRFSGGLHPKQAKERPKSTPTTTRRRH